MASLVGAVYRGGARARESSSRRFALLADVFFRRLRPRSVACTLRQGGAAAVCAWVVGCLGVPCVPGVCLCVCVVIWFASSCVSCIALHLGKEKVRF